MEQNKIHQNCLTSKLIKFGEQIKLQGKEIIACILLWLFIAKLNQSIHFYHTLWENLEGILRGNQKEHISFFFLDVFITTIFTTFCCFAIWLNPLVLHSRVVVPSIDANYDKYFDEENQFPLSIVATLPAYIIFSGLVVSYIHVYSSGSDGVEYLIFGLLLVFIYLAYKLEEYAKSNFYRVLKITLGSLFVLYATIVFVVYRLANLPSDAKNGNIYYLLGLISLIVAMFFFSFLHFIFLNKITQKKGESKADSINPINLIAAFLGIKERFFKQWKAIFAQPTFSKMVLEALPIALYFSGIFSYFIIFLYRGIAISPIFIFPLVIGMFFLVWDFCHRNFSYYFYIVALSILYFFGHDDIHKFQLVEESSKIKSNGRVSFDEYFIKKVAQNNNALISKDSTIYLVAGEGGGSKAATIFSTVMTRCYADIFENIFAVSTVSGSSVGMAATYQYSELPKTKSDSLLQHDFIHAVFGKNYITEGIKGLLMRDAIMRYIPFLSNRCFDNRNVILQLQETNAFLNSNKERKDWISLNDRTKEELNECWYRKPFLDYFYDANGKIKIDKPLFFPNTVRVNDGKKGISSPVITNGLFTDAIDIIGEIDNIVDEKGNKTFNTLRFSEAVNLSQAFPALNASPGVGNSGTFFDGGGFENRGLYTLLEIYERIKRIQKDANLLNTLLAEHIPDSTKRGAIRDLVTSLKIKVLVIYKSEMEDFNPTDDVNPTLLSPINLASNSPFSGHTDYIHKKFKRIVADYGGVDVFEDRLFFKEKKTQKDTMWKISKMFSYSKDDNDIIMSRWLSEKDLNKIMAKMNSKVEDLKL